MARSPLLTSWGRLTTRARWLLPILVVVAIFGIGVAATAERQRLTDSDWSESLSHADGASLPDEPVTAEELTERRRLGALELAKALADTAPERYRRAEASGGPSVAGNWLAAELEATSWDRLTGMLLVGVESEVDGDWTYESVTYGDGEGDLRIWWQTWPAIASAESAQGLVGEFGQVTQHGDLDIITDLRSYGNGSTSQMIRVFDGDRLLSVMAFDLSVEISVEELQQFALALFDRLPRD